MKPSPDTARFELPRISEEYAACLLKRAHELGNAAYLKSLTHLLTSHALGRTENDNVDSDNADSDSANPERAEASRSTRGPRTSAPAPRVRLHSQRPRCNPRTRQGTPCAARVALRADGS